MPDPMTTTPDRFTPATPLGEEPIRTDLRRRITNAYYSCRNKGETMETAATRAADSVMEVVRGLIAERDAIAEDEQAAVDEREAAGSAGAEAERPDGVAARSHDVSDVFDATQDMATVLSEEAQGIDRWLDSVMARLPNRYESDYEAVSRVAIWTGHYDRIRDAATGKLPLATEREAAGSAGAEPYGYLEEIVQLAERAINSLHASETATRQAQGGPPLDVPEDEVLRVLADAAYLEPNGPNVRDALRRLHRSGYTIARLGVAPELSEPEEQRG